MKNFHSLRVLCFTLATLTIFSITTAYAEQKTFPDVTDETQYKSSIEWMQKNEIINGYPDGTFAPDKCVNRAEFLKMLFKILQVDVNGATAELFTDTPAEEWYAPYVRAAREHNTIQGYKDGRFRPNQCVTRAEAIKMAVFEYNNNKIPQKPNNPMLTSAKDVTENKWYYKHITYALQANLAGLSHTTIVDQDGDPNVIIFYPEKEMSRKEIAEMLYRMKTMADNYVDSYREEHKPDTLIFGKAEVNFEINQILLTSSNDPKIGDTLEFDIYLERPDLQLKENIEYDIEMPLTVDLPIPLQPKLMYVSTIDDKDQTTGAMCDRPRFPHRCSWTFIGDELTKSEHTVLIKLTFEDDTYVAKEITIPHPKALDKPEIVGLAKTPDQNSKFDVEFKDVGANEYDISVELCKPYGNDGINPCLDGTMYHLTRDKDSNTFTVSYGGDTTAQVNVQNGLIKVKSDFLLIFEESMSYYVIATLKGKTGADITTLVTNSDSKFYPVESAN